MCEFDVFILEGVESDAEAVVLAGYFDLAGFQVFDGVVCASVAELQFVGFCAEGEA